MIEHIARALDRARAPIALMACVHAGALAIHEGSPSRDAVRVVLWIYLLVAPLFAIASPWEFLRR